MIHSSPTSTALTGLLKRRGWHAFGFSLAGLKRVWQEEAFRVEAIMTLVLVPVALSLQLAPIERLALIGVLLLVLIVETLNTAVEVTIDHISTERHPLAKQAKDLGSAAVLLSLALALLTWVVLPWF